MSECSPEPWAVDVDVRGKQREFIVDKEGRAIAYVFSGPNRLGNSTLMSLAPQMRDALIAAYNGTIEKWQLENIISAATNKPIKEAMS